MARVRDEVEQGPKPASDAYTGLLAISLGAMITGCALLYMDYSSYPDKAPPKAPTPVAPRSLEGGSDNQPPPAPPPAGAPKQ